MIGEDQADMVTRLGCFGHRLTRIINSVCLVDADALRERRQIADDRRTDIGLIFDHDDDQFIHQYLLSLVRLAANGPVGIEGRRHTP